MTQLMPVSSIPVIPFSQFKADYIEQHPASVPQKADILSAYPAFMKWGTLAMFLCAALISGVHTVPTVFDGMEIAVALEVRQIVALLSFVAYELAIFISAYARMLSKSLTPLLTLLIAVAVAVVANIHSTTKAMAVVGSDPMTGLVALIIGVGAPLLALAAGEFYVRMHSSDRAALLRAADDFQKRSEIFDALVVEAWNEYRAQVQARIDAEVEAQRHRDAEERQRQIEEARLAERRQRDQERRDERQRAAQLPPSIDFTTASREISREKQRENSDSRPGVNLREVGRLIHEAGEEDKSADYLQQKYGISLGGTSKARKIALGMKSESSINSELVVNGANREITVE